MFPKKALAAALPLAILSSCRAPPPAPQDLAATESEAGYITPPAATTAAPTAHGLIISGEASPGSAVRLAAPAGAALTTHADPQGRWSLELPSAGEARIFGLSAEGDGRRVQAQGYVLVGPHGQAAMLRSGTSTVRLDHAAGSRIAALDFDGEGWTLLSGWAAPGTDVLVRLDGKPVGDARTDEAGRFALSLRRLPAGAHRIEATGVAFTDAISFDTAPAAPLAAGPLRSQVTAHGLRADWLTPGGGVQTTLLAG